MGFRSALTNNARPVSPSDRRVLDVLMSEDNAAELTAAQVAERAQAHESTVVRLAQKLGYRGYAELRDDLRRDELGHRAPRGMRNESGHDVASLAADEAQALALMGRHLRQEDVDAVARAVHTASRVYLLHWASAPEAVDLLTRRLRRLGKVVVPVGPTPREVAEGFVTFEQNCLLMAFGLGKIPQSLPPLIAAAQGRGGGVVLITDTPGYGLEPRPDYILAAGRGRDSGFRTLLVPMAIVYALQLAVHHLQPEHYLSVTESIDDLTRLAGGWDQVPLRPS
ncbi:MurR/RpiR family transcriptional regulator [Ornithinimicrobium cerasi]|uniref:MurR/RpiR family transcriptional regulator n=1 Tax=Ornithinimicrobium cerasi TaxID=2248773 RepID=UPI00137AB551|nr:MurR/RpiR family transcriptional regulator [Ornithinimicrobium cerasi]